MYILQLSAEESGCGILVFTTSKNIALVCDNVLS